MVEMHQKMLQEEENMLQMLQKALSKDVSIYINMDRLITHRLLIMQGIHINCSEWYIEPQPVF